MRLASWLPTAAVPEAQGAATNLPIWDLPEDVAPTDYVHGAERVLRGEVDFYGRWTAVGDPEVDWNQDPVSGVRAPLAPGASLDYRDSKLVGSARNTWEVNRHLQLVTLAQAWRVTGDGRYRSACLDMLASWHRACPYPFGINWVSALEHGIRLVNWYLASRLLRPAGPESAHRDWWLDSVYRHCDFIWRHQSRYSSANNHLIGEMAGLYVASTAWPCWPVSSRWREESKRILERETQAQVHSDGVSREQTVGYQMFVLQFLIIAGLVGEQAGDPFSQQYWATVRRMIVFLRSIRDVAGNLPDFGDSDEGVVFVLAPDARQQRVATLLEMAETWSGSRDTGRRALDSASAWLSSGFPRPSNWPIEAMAGRRVFPEGGYFILGSHFGEPEEVSLVFDAGPLGYLGIAAHGHADCLSFTLSIGGEQILIDPGTYCYHDKPQWRDYFRSTRAHNTVCVDGVDQSQIGGPFLWLRKAQPTVEIAELEGAQQRIRASHNGYRSLKDPVTHIRELQLDTRRATLKVFDHVKAVGEHVVERFWHFGTHCQLVPKSDKAIEIRAGRVVLLLSVDLGAELELVRGRRNPKAGWASPRFDDLQQTYSVRVANSGIGAMRLKTKLSWQFGSVAS